MIKIIIILFSAFFMFSSMMLTENSIYDSWKIKAKSELKMMNDSITNLLNYNVNNFHNLHYIISDSFPLDSTRKFIFNQIYKNKKYQSIEIFEEYGSGEVPFYLLHVMETGNNDTINYYYDVYRKLKPKKYKDFYMENIVYSNFRNFDIINYLRRNKKFITNGKTHLNHYMSYTNIVQDEVVSFKIISNYEFEASDSINWNRIHSK